MVCPIIDDDKPQCAKELRLENVGRALSQCGNSFEDCPIYLRHFQEKMLQRIARRGRKALRSA